MSRALIEINTSNEMINSLVVAVPMLKESGYTKETICIEYEWKLLRCGTCLIYGHSYDSCPKAVKVGTAAVQKDVDDGFRVVKKGTKGGNNKHVIRPKSRYEYRPIMKTTYEASTSKEG
ncbi:reverse transcriptase domain-containing protein [Artemisia annua]|uniref:Reverse transcriptase domain-containing protein n=1 Tax=Artemisia annua TaxID=35608 RepID=A0A2U1LFE3_ARTAN|nr:reverse transcriptase domain-containing protein [Artemisia annua]